MHVADEPARFGAWRVVADTTAAGGKRLEHPNVNGARISTPLASPATYVDIPVTVVANTPYHLWLRGKAFQNFGDNDSVWVQTSGTVNASGAAIYRIGTTSATMVNLEDCAGCRISNWGWQDNGYGSGVTGPLLTFATSGSHEIRIQAREDGISLDQLVLSPATYLTARPGAAANDSTILPEANGSGGGGTSITLVRGPYLQQVGANEATVVWATRQSGSASVRHRAGSLPFEVTAATSTFWASSVTGLGDYYQHEAVLTGLTPNTSYEYDLRVGSADPTPGVVDHLRTAPTPGTGTVRLVAFGDSGNGSAAQQQVASRIASDTFDLALHTGDIAYSHGTYAQYESFFFPFYRAWMRQKAVFPSIGNHDDRTGSATPYRRFFVLPRDGGSIAYPNNAERFYSFDFGPVHFIALDTEAAFLSSARRKEQIAWLTQDLQAAQDRPWRVAFFHRPPYNSGVEHGSELPVRQAFGPLFERYNVQLVVSGHEHSYERSVPWRESSNTSWQAVTYIVTGGGGGGLYPTGDNPWTAFSRSAHHYVRATISASSLTLEAVGATGTVFDRFTLNRGVQEDDGAAPTVSVAAPASGTILSGTERIEATADDDGRIEKVDLWVDGKLTAIDHTAPYDFSLSTTSFANGSHVLEVRAYDIDGRRASSKRTVTIAN